MNNTEVLFIKTGFLKIIMEIKYPLTVINAIC